MRLFHRCILARGREQSSAAAYLWHSLGDQGAAESLSAVEGGSCPQVRLALFAHAVCPLLSGFCYKVKAEMRLHLLFSLRLYQGQMTIVVRTVSVTACAQSGKLLGSSSIHVTV